MRELSVALKCNIVVKLSVVLARFAEDVPVEVPLSKVYLQVNTT